MTWNFTTLCTWCCSFAFLTVLAVHYSQMKSPSQYREIASFHAQVKPLYDASFKL